MPKRLPKELIEKIKKKRKEGFSYSKLSIEFKVPSSTIYYIVNDKYREKKKKFQREYQKRSYKKNKYTPEQKAKRNENSKRYFKEKYKNDKEFREKHIKRVKENKKNRRKNEGH
jgi:hypothetical protein